MPQALKQFIEERGQAIIQKGLFRNFILHLGKKVLESTVYLLSESGVLAFYFAEVVIRPVPSHYKYIKPKKNAGTSKSILVK